MSRHRIALAMTAGVASTLLLAACGSSSGDSADAAAATPATSASAGTTAPAASGTSTSSSGMGMVGTNMLMAKKMSGLGTMVTDAKGWTLYRYGKDHVNMSMCTGSCARTWMPVMAEGTPKGMGVQAEVGTVTRNDGMKQITLAGWPLYRYMGDTKAGDMNGQGKNGMWSAVTPTGKKMAASSRTSTSSGSKSDSNGGMSGMPGM